MIAQFKTITLLGLLSALLVSISYGIVGGQRGLYLGLTLAAAINFCIWYYCHHLALATYQAQPLTPSQEKVLVPMVQKLCARANLPLPKLYIIPTSVPNAFATGRNPDHAIVALSEGIIHLLPTEELEAVIAHELSHIKHHDTLISTVAATLASAIAFLADLASDGFSSSRRKRTHSLNLLAWLLTVFLAPLAAAILQLSLSRTREYAADAGAAEITNNPRALASALQRLENGADNLPFPGNPAFASLLIINPLADDLVSNLFSTHPPTDKRREKLLNFELYPQSIANKQGKKLRQNLLAASISSFVIALMWGILTYNYLANEVAIVEARWAQVESQLQRRADLIPTLINVTQTHAQHQESLVSLLITSHQSYLQAVTLEEKSQAIAEINRAINSLQDYASNNLSLQSSQLFINLQYEITGTENRLAVERMRYNQAVQKYDRFIHQFPNIIIARKFGFHPFSFWEINNSGTI
jgi:heat shock protein HtpX